MKYGIVVTTINYIGEFLLGYKNNFEKYGHMDDVIAYIIPDKKTPPMQEIPRMWPENIVLPEIAAQEQFIKRLGGRAEFFPYNSDRRRNIGYLMAMEDNCDVVISLDDDNHCSSDADFLVEHSRATVDLASAYVYSGWINPCSLFGNCNVYARGFPYYVRKTKSEYKVAFGHTENVKIRVNAGLWEGQPDMDAMSWLHTPVYNTVSRSGAQVILSGKKENNAWAPICSQNTAVHSELMPAYYFLNRGRFGDIFQGYFLQAVMKHFGYSVRFGSPYVQHKRNSHSYIKDMIHEHPFIVQLEELLPKLVEVKLSGSTVAEAYLSLADWLMGLDDSYAEMKEWIKLCKNIGVTV